MYIVIPILLLAAVALFFLQKYMRNVQPFEREVEEDLAIMRETLKEFKDGCLPFTSNNLEVMAFNNADELTVKGGVSYQKGMFVTDSAEPIMAYLYKRYIGPGENALLYAIIDKHELVYRINNSGTSVSIDGQKLGTIRKDVILHDVKFNRPIGAIAEDTENGTVEVTVSGVYAGRVPLYNKSTNSLMPPGSQPPNPMKLDQQEQLAFSALAVWGVVRGAV